MTIGQGGSVVGGGGGGGFVVGGGGGGGGGFTGRQPQTSMSNLYPGGQTLGTQKIGNSGT